MGRHISIYVLDIAARLLLILTCHRQRTKAWRPVREAVLMPWWDGVILMRRSGGGGSELQGVVGGL